MRLLIQETFKDEHFSVLCSSAQSPSSSSEAGCGGTARGTVPELAGPAQHQDPWLHHRAHPPQPAMGISCSRHGSRVHAVLLHGVWAGAPQAMQFWCKPSTRRLQSAKLISQPACTKSLFVSEGGQCSWGSPGGNQLKVSSACYSCSC